MGWEEAYQYWLQVLRARNRESRTWVTYSFYVRSFADAVEDPLLVTHRDIMAWLDGQPQWGAAAHRSAQSALASFYRVMVDEQVIDVSPMDRVPRTKAPRRLPRPAEESQVAQGLAVRDEDTWLMVALASKAGLRRAEIAGLRREDVVRGGVLVRGKGSRQRWVPVDPETLTVLTGRGPGWVFPGRFDGHVHPATVYRKIREAAEVSPHPLRHRYATAVYDRSGDLLSVRDLLGHQSTVTTEGYVALAQARLREAASGAWTVDQRGPRLRVA